MDRSYLFRVTPPDADILIPQVSELLEQAVQTVSREKYPQLWKLTDRLNSVPKASKKELKHRRIRTKILSVICLLLGIFLFVPGLMKPQELTGPLFMGALAVGSGIGGLWRSRKKKKEKCRDPRYDRAASQLLEEYAALAEASGEIAFTETDCSADGSSVFESEDVFLLFTESGTRILVKKDLTEGNIEDFRDFLRTRAAFFAG